MRLEFGAIRVDRAARESHKQLGPAPFGPL